MFLNSIEPLEWDSHFFNYPIAKIVLDHQGHNYLENLFKELASKKIRLTYLFVPVSEKELNNHITNKGCILVDQKIVYAKKPQEHTEFSNKIFEFQGAGINERLISLVLQAGKFSRFRIDKNFINNEYKRLYIEWLKKSINKELSNCFFVAQVDSEIVGISTLGEKNGKADISLVAVDKNFRGRKIGYDLIHTADSSAFSLEYDEIKVVTQLRNYAACRLYEKCNFSIESITNVYHFWQ